MNREQLPLPPELAVPGALVAQGVDVELDLAEQVVRVARNTFDDPEAALGEGRGAGGRPCDALPARVHEADERDVRPFDVPSLAVDPAVLRFSLEVRLFRDAELIGLADELPREVFDLPVEELPVVLTRVGSEEAVRTIRGRRRADASQCGH